jgi:hypothetical protein
MGVGLLIRSLPFPSLSTSTGRRTASGPSPMIQSIPNPTHQLPRFYSAGEGGGGQAKGTPRKAGRWAYERVGQGARRWRAMSKENPAPRPAREATRRGLVCRVS